ncbi:MAG TPA: hypothetical protein VJ461_04335 [Candidatus Nanoarchaeia archaeon]|nr:hypothetical protein [Candidatus Nanoarchaeia archaeon]
MFVLPKDIARKIILGELDYNKLPYNHDNEKAKGFYLEDQARVNLALEKKHQAKCTALEEICHKEECRFYIKGTGRIKKGWACMEYKVDFPTASFDSRYHVTFIGSEMIELRLTSKNIKELEKKGARSFCLGCGYPYEKIPLRLVEARFDNNGYLEVCLLCDSWEFHDADSFITRIEIISWLNSYKENA